MIAIKREKLEQVLEALTYCEALNRSVQEQKMQAITTIKEALAQPEQKPVAWEQFHGHLVERNFCPRCGKRLASGFVEISIHTCTPPRDIK